MSLRIQFNKIKIIEKKTLVFYVEYNEIKKIYSYLCEIKIFWIS